MFKITDSFYQFYWLLKLSVKCIIYSPIIYSSI